MNEDRKCRNIYGEWLGNRISTVLGSLSLSLDGLCLTTRKVQSGCFEFVVPRAFWAELSLPPIFFHLSSVSHPDEIYFPSPKLKIIYHTSRSQPTKLTIIPFCAARQANPIFDISWYEIDTIWYDDPQRCFWILSEFVGRLIKVSSSVRWQRISI